jgi:hypothetical protein
VLRKFLPLILLTVFLPVAHSQTSQRDPAALALLTSAQTQMGAGTILDSLASGSITTTAGSLTEDGTVRLLTRGVDQTAERFVMPDATLALIFSRGLAIQKRDGVVQANSLELASTSLSPLAPLSLISAIVQDSDFNIQAVGQETLDNGVLANRIRVWKSYASDSGLRQFATLSGRIIWLDAQTNLPAKISYIRRPAQGAVAGTRVDVYLSDYRQVGSAVYPFSIKESLNGTPWATITINNVAFNTGLTDSDFPTE